MKTGFGQRIPAISLIANKARLLAKISHTIALGANCSYESGINIPRETTPHSKVIARQVEFAYVILWINCFQILHLVMNKVVIGMVTRVLHDVLCSK